MTHLRLLPYGLIALSLVIEPLIAQQFDDPKTSVQLVNVTSVPTISLTINDSVKYPVFRQGLFTDGEATSMLSQSYEVTEVKTGITVKSPPIKFKPDTHQALVIMGDFSTPSSLNSPSETRLDPEEPSGPNLLLRVYPFESDPDKWMQIRVINAMPGKKLIFRSEKNGETRLNPGQDIVLDSQAPGSFFEGEIDGRKLPVSIMPTQRVNVMVIFFLKKGEPTSIRVFDYGKNASTTE